MSSITIRQLDPDVKQRLRVRAAEKGRSMEAEVRAILRGALLSEENLRKPENAEAQSFGELIRQIVEPVGGVELDIPPRDGRLADLLLRRAQENSRSVETEARCIFEEALSVQKSVPEENLADAFQHLVDEFGSADLVLPPRGPAPPPVNFE